MANKQVITIESKPGEIPLHMPDLCAEETGFDSFCSDEFDVEENARLLSLGVAVVLASEDQLGSFIEAKISPDKIIDKKRSAHQVGFGSLIDSERTFTGSQRKHSVAFKPFNRPEPAAREVRGYLALQELGVETYEPIGIYPSKDQERYVVITRKRPDLTSLDRDTWIVGRSVVDEASEEIAQRNSETVKGISSMLAYIHSNGVYHPDGQLKNYAATPEGEIGIIDTENLTKASLDDESSANRAWYDIEKLVKSLIINTLDREDATLYGVGMLEGMSLKDTRRCLEELVISPYLDALLIELENCSNERAEHIQRLFDGVQSFYNDKNWPNHLIGKMH